VNVMNLPIKRVTLFTVKVPVPFERINCPEFSHEPLNRGPTGGWDGEFFANVPFYIVKVEGDGGPAGWADTNRLVNRQDLLSSMGRLIGMTPAQIRSDDMETWGTMPKGLHAASLDWSARMQDVPLWKLFGEKVRDGVLTADWSGHRTPQGAAEMAKKAKAKGFHCLKLKASMEQDTGGIIAAIRDACGPDFHVVIDPNGRWETVEESVRRARIMMDACPTSSQVEDAVYGKLGYEAMKKMREETGIFTIRTVTEEKGVRDCAEYGINGMNLNGRWPVLHRTSKLAHELGIPYWVGSAVESGIGDLTTIHFALTQPAFTLSCELAGHMVREHPMYDRPIVYRDGYSYPPEGPGLGANADEHAIAKYSIADPLVVE